MKVSFGRTSSAGLLFVVPGGHDWPPQFLNSEESENVTLDCNFFLLNEHHSNFQLSKVFHQNFSVGIHFAKVICCILFLLVDLRL